LVTARSGPALPSASMRQLLAQTRRMAGRALLDHLTLWLSRLLGGAYVQIGRLSEDGRSIHAEPCAQHGELLPGLRYDLADTPCAHVVDAETQYFDGDVAERFSADVFLRQSGFVSYLGCPMFDSGGRPTGLLSVLSTNTLGFGDAELALLEALALRAGADMERIAAVEARLAHEALFREILDHQAEMVCRFSPAGTVTFANRAYLETCGITQEDLGSFDYTPLMHPDDLERVRAALAEIRPDAPSVVIENRIFTADGRTLWMQWTNLGLYDDRGNLVGFQATGRDVTGAKLAQERLREAHEQKDRFLAMLAHELRNPLGGILNALAVLELGAREGRCDARAMAIAKRQAQQQARLLDDLLDLSRITRGKVVLHKVALPLFRVVSEVAEAQRAAFSSKSQSLLIDLPPEEVDVHADRVRLEQIVANLLDNACKYTPAHGWVRLEGRAVEGVATLRIIDSGRGVPSAMQERIFDMFQQLPHEGALASGLGIGLTVVRELLDRHDGSITVDSPGEGQGSTFTVRLPISSTPASSEPPTARPERAAGPSRRRILVVDDNEDAADMLAHLLRAWGHDVVVVYDGETALRAARDDPPELVLMDIAMPGLDGYATVRRLREMHPSSGMKVVALTGFGQAADMQRARDAHFDHHLTKPADHAALRRIIEPAAS
jgi:PAS domain S-box-containing protein